MKRVLIVCELPPRGGGGEKAGTAEKGSHACSRRRLVSWGGSLEAKLEGFPSPKEPVEFVLSRLEWEALTQHLSGHAMTPEQVRLLHGVAHVHCLDGLREELKYLAVGVCANCGATLSLLSLSTRCRRPFQNPSGKCTLCHSAGCSCARDCELPTHVLLPCG